MENTIHAQRIQSLVRSELELDLSTNIAISVRNSFIEFNKMFPKVKLSEVLNETLQLFKNMSRRLKEIESSRKIWCWNMNMTKVVATWTTLADSLLMSVYFMNPEHWTLLEEPNVTLIFSMKTFC